MSRPSTTADVIVALDVPSTAEALELVDALGPRADFFKVGLQLYTCGGMDVVRTLGERGKRVFLDLKLHDIPNTVGRATLAAAEAGVELLTLHALGGSAMMEAAVDAARESRRELRLLAVTVLTSSSAADVEATWGRSIRSVRDEVLRLAELARESGVHGVVSSPLEVEALRRRLGPDALLVTPGIRLPGGDVHDQSRVATPHDAVRAGADALVVGRTVTGAADPAAALEAVFDDMHGAVEEAP